MEPQSDYIERLGLFGSRRSTKSELIVDVLLRQGATCNADKSVSLISSVGPQNKPHDGLLGVVVDGRGWNCTERFRRRPVSFMNVAPTALSTIRRGIRGLRWEADLSRMRR